MNLAQLISFVDGIKPNGYTDAQKTIWVNDVAARIQTEIYLLPASHVYTYVYGAAKTVGGVSFPDSATVVFAEEPGFSKNGLLTISGLTGSFAANNIISAKILDILADGKTYVFAESTFTYSNITETADGGTYTFDGSQVELLADAAHQKVYWAYLAAMIDFANGEYDKFNNSRAVFGDFFGEYARWYARTYNPAKTWVAPEATVAGGSKYSKHVTLAGMIAFVDGIKPNSYTNAQKTIWLNELEALIQTDIYLLAPSDVSTYVYSLSRTDDNVMFADSATLVFIEGTGFRKYGLLTISGLTGDFAANNVTSAKILDISADGKTLTFAEGTFSYTSATVAAVGGNYAFDGSQAELLADAAHQKVYWTYLSAMIDFANGEYGRFNNALTIFGDFFGEYSRWYARTYNPANGLAEEKGYYLSSYGLAVKHGYGGTEEEWLLTLKGDQGDGLVILDLYATLAELQAAHATGNVVGDCYAVGTAASNVIYFWNGSEFINLGSLKGDKGETGDTGVMGNGISSICRTSGNGAAGTTDTYTITFTDATTTTFTVYNGTDGKLLANGNGYALDNGSTRPTLGTKAVDLSYTTDNTYGATGIKSFCEGDTTKAIGDYSHAEGQWSEASGYSSHAEGRSTASNRSAHSEGEWTTASGTDSHSEGNSTKASGNYSHAEGYACEASGEGSHAEGSDTVASGNYSHAEGSDTVASITYSHAEGDATTASGAASHAEGAGSTASGSRSHAQNRGTVAQGMSQTAIGEYNIAQGSTASRVDADYAFIIGNGTDSVNRRNALTVDWAGNLMTAGTVNGRNMTTDGTKLDGIAAGAEANINADWNATSGDAQILNKPTSISGYGITDAYTKTEVDNMVSAVYKFKGSVATYANLPSSGLTSGDVYNVTDTDMNYSWTGTAWDPLGRTYALATAADDGLMSQADFGKLAAIEAGAEVNNISDANATDLTDSGDTSLHYHAADRNRANHTGTQTASTISDFDTEVANNTDVAANTAARHTHGNSTVLDNSTASYTTAEQTKLAGIAAGATVGKLLANGSGYALNNGSTRMTLGTGAVDLSNTANDTTGAIGDYSQAEGVRTTASGLYSHAEGYYNQALGESSHAEGSTTIAQGSHSHVEGYCNIATPTGINAHAEGSSTTAGGDSSHSEGNGSTASGCASHAQNKGTIAWGYAQTAIGAYNIAQGSADSSASTDHALIIGNGTSDASRSNALTVDWAGNLIAAGTVNGRDMTTDGTKLDGIAAGATVGKLLANGSGYALDNGSTRPALGSNAVDLSYTTGGVNGARGNMSYVKGQDNIALTYLGHAEGLRTMAAHGSLYKITAYDDVNKTITLDNVSNLAVGDLLQIKRSNFDCIIDVEISAISNLVVTLNTTESITSYWKYAIELSIAATQRPTHAEGMDTVSSGSFSHAEGVASVAKGSNSHAEGQANTASGGNSHAEGMLNTASGMSSHVEGNSNTASGASSHAEGMSNTASGSQSHAEGQSTVASGSQSHAQNTSTIAQGKSQTVIGEHNIAQGTGTSRVNTDYAFIIGNGTADVNRSNALTVDWTGNLAATGTVTASNLSGTNTGDQDLSGYSLKTTINTNSDASPAFGTIADNNEYRCTNMSLTTAPTMTIAAISDTSTEFVCSVIFKAPNATAPVVTNNSGYTIKYYGQDVSNGTWTPVANIVYRMSFVFDGIYLNIYISGV